MQAAAALQHSLQAVIASRFTDSSSGRFIGVAIEHNLVTMLVPCPSSLHTVYKTQPPAPVSAK